MSAICQDMLAGISLCVTPEGLDLIPTSAATQGNRNATGTLHGLRQGRGPRGVPQGQGVWWQGRAPLGVGGRGVGGRAGCKCIQAKETVIPAQHTPLEQHQCIKINYCMQSPVTAVSFSIMILLY